MNTIADIPSAPFSPSRVDFFRSNRGIAAIPFVGLFGRSESEAAASIVVRCCQAMDDMWNGISWPMASSVLVGAPGPLGPFLDNPFWKPDPTRLVADGFADWCDFGGHHKGLFLTAKAFDAFVAGGWVHGEPPA